MFVKSRTPAAIVAVSLSGAEAAALHTLPKQRLVRRARTSMSAVPRLRFAAANGARVADPENDDSALYDTDDGRGTQIEQK